MVLWEAAHRQEKKLLGQVETVRCGRCLVGRKEESGVKVGMCSQDYVMIGAVRAHVDDKKGAKYGVPTS